MSSSPPESAATRLGSVARKVKDALLRPIDWRFNHVSERLIAHTAHLHNVETAAMAEQAEVVRVATDSFGYTLREEAHALVDLTVALERRADRLERVAEALSSDGHGLPRDVPLADLSSELTAYLDWAISYKGPLAERGLWFNHALDMRFSDGGRIAGVNERIVEVPYVHARVLAQPAGSRILDFGATESELSVVAASYGHQVTAVDLRPYPVEHPNLRSIVGPVESLEDPEEPYDLIVSLSALEHVGLGSYGEDEKELDLDRRIVERFRSWLRPGGQLVLTVPFGRWEVTPTQRIYDDQHIAELLDGWDVVDRAVVRRRGTAVWTPVEAGDDEPDTGYHDVLLTTVTPRP